MPALAKTISLSERLSARRGEIEQAILTRIYSVSDPTEEGDSEYVAGLRAAVAAAVDYGISSVESGDFRRRRVPPALISQAGQAARTGVSLDTVLRRYFAGYTLLADFVMREARATRHLEMSEVHRLSRAHAALFDRVVVAITEAYTREEEERHRAPEYARVERVKRLIAGELVDEGELGYEFDAHHLGLVACGPGSLDALRSLAATLDRRLLLVRPDGLTVWAWLGGRKPLDTPGTIDVLGSGWPARAKLSIGEPAAGTCGWRLSHRQALAALPVALRSSEQIVRYADVAVLASALQDDLLTTSLQQIYLAPLETERDSETLCDTLRAYFAAEQNISSTAAALGVNRHTVANRLQRIEECLDRALSSCRAEIEVALALHKMAHFAPASDHTGRERLSGGA
ncbi:MAG TPA: helix-turn-helix domain-containing protein [Solirubrobacterales bacterium]|nr:helix-turn-helix domain-containing protein [Solirubrobacterales bacterium]